MIDSFQKLPEEIIIQILESCWDFTSLDGLLQISLKANEVFDTYYPRITEAVVASCSMTSGFNDHKFRLVVAIQAAAIGPRTLRKCLEDKHWEPMPPVMESIFWSLECSTPIRQAINSAAKVHRLACICYDSFIENVKKAKPARPNVSENEIMTGFAPIHQCDQQCRFRLMLSTLHPLSSSSGFITLYGHLSFILIFTQRQQHAGHGPPRK